MSNVSATSTARQRSVALCLVLGLVAAPSVAQPADPIQLVDDACPGIEVRQEVGSWGKVSAGVEGAWLANGSAGDTALSDADSTMEFAGAVLTEVITSGGSVTHRSLSGADGSTVRSIWADLEAKKCWKAEGSLSAQGNVARREMGTIKLVYERFDEPTGDVPCGTTCYEGDTCDDGSDCPSGGGTCPAC